MIKTEQKRRRIQLSKTTRPNFHIKTLNDEAFSSPQLFLEINSIPQPQSSLSKTVKELLEEQINVMLDQISRIINEYGLNTRETMNYVRSSVLFKEIDEINNNVVNEIVGEYARNKIEALEAALQEKTRQLEQLKKERKQQQDFNQQNLKIRKVSRLSLPKQVQNFELMSLYNKAKTSSYHDFQELYRQRQVSNRLEFIQISNLTPKSKRQSTKHLDQKQQKKGRLMRVLTPLLNNLSEQERTDLLQILREELTHECPNPCCKWVESSVQEQNRSSSALFNKKQAKNNSFYRSDKINEYYKRYYHSAFDVNKIISVTKTKTEEMDRLYKIHKTREKLWQKKKVRSQSTV